MSNKFKIKNIWTPEVSREEYAKTLSEWDKALSSLDDKIQGIYNSGISSPTTWDFTATRTITLNANTWNRIPNTLIPVGHQLQIDTMYLLSINMGSFTSPFETYEIIIRMKNYPNGITYTLTTPSTSYTFSIKIYNHNTIEIYPDKNWYVADFRLKRLYIK